MTTDEILAYQAAVRVVAAASAEKVRRRGGSPREIAERYDEVEVFCGRPEPIVRVSGGGVGGASYNRSSGLNSRALATGSQLASTE